MKHPLALPIAFHDNHPVLNGVAWDPDRALQIAHAARAAAPARKREKELMFAEADHRIASLTAETRRINALYPIRNAAKSRPKSLSVTQAQAALDRLQARARRSSAQAQRHNFKTLAEAKAFLRDVKAKARAESLGPISVKDAERQLATMQARHALSNLGLPIGRR